MRVDFAHLKNDGVRAILVDLDETIFAQHADEVSDEVASMLRHLDLPVYIATNRPVKRDIAAIAEQINAAGILQPTSPLRGKPSKKYYLHAEEVTHEKLEHICMIGDRPLQDIIGANRAGLKTVAVYKFSGKNTLFNGLDDYLWRLVGRSYLEI